MTEVQNDPDRVLHPLRRTRRRAEASSGSPGTRRSTTSAAGCARSATRHGGDSVGWYMGNPGAFSYSHPLWVKGFLDGLGSPHYYTASSQDVSNRFAASHFLYGSPFLVADPRPRAHRPALVLGANPLVSHGSVMSAPRIKDQLHAITERGGRVVVVDPRRTETAREFEHVAGQPRLRRLAAALAAPRDLRRGARGRGRDRARSRRGVAALREMVAPHSPERTEAATGVPAADVRQLARDIADADTRAAIYGRTGSCLGRNGTLVSFLLDALALVTGNLDVAGGAMFGDAGDRLRARGPHARARHLRQGALAGSAASPTCSAQLPATVMAKEITTPGKGQMRALFVSAGNPVLSVPNGDELEAALPELDLMVSIDIYVNDTNRHADYVLPATTFLEREDFPLPFLALFTTPFIQATEPVVEPYGEARQEWEVIEQIARAGRLRAVGLAGAAALARQGRRAALAEAAGRHAPAQRAEGRPVRPAPRRAQPEEAAREPARDRPRRGAGRPGVLGDKVRHRGGKVRLDPPEIVEDAERLAARAAAERRVPAADDRDARAALAQLLDAQLGEADARRAAPHSARIHPERRRRRSGSRTATAAGSPPRTARSRPRPAHRRGQARHDRRPARLGPPRRQLAPRGRRRRREPERARLDRARRPRAARRHGPPERDPGAAGGGGARRRAGARP